MLELDPSVTHTRETEPCQRLWLAATQLMVHDAISYLKDLPGYRNSQARQAYLDLKHCGQSTRYLCSMTGLDPQVVSQGFNKQIQRLEHETD